MRIRLNDSNALVFHGDMTHLPNVGDSIILYRESGEILEGELVSLVLDVDGGGVPAASLRLALGDLYEAHSLPG